MLVAAFLSFLMGSHRTAALGDGQSRTGARRRLSDGVEGFVEAVPEWQLLYSEVVAHPSNRACGT